jgi:hypothetical protein
MRELRVAAQLEREGHVHLRLLESLERASSLTTLHLTMDTADLHIISLNVLASAQSLVTCLRSMAGLSDLALTFRSPTGRDRYETYTGVSLSGEAHDSVQATLAGLTALTALRVSAPVATAAGAAACTLTQLRHLDVCDVCILAPCTMVHGAPRAEPLFRALRDLSALTALRLHLQQLGPARLSLLATAVQAMPWLEGLDLAGLIGPQSANDSGLRAFSDTLARPRGPSLLRLRSLRLAEDPKSHNRRAESDPTLEDPETHAALERVLRATPGLTSLDLSTLRLPPSAAVVLAPALAGLVALERLRLGPRCDVDGVLVPLICALPPEHCLRSVAEGVAGEPAGSISLSHPHARALAEHLLVAPLHARLLSAFFPADAAARDEIVSRLPRLALHLADTVTSHV